MKKDAIYMHILTTTKTNPELSLGLCCKRFQGKMLIRDYDAKNLGLDREHTNGKFASQKYNTTSETQAWHTQ